MKKLSWLLMILSFFPGSELRASPELDYVERQKKSRRLILEETDELDQRINAAHQNQDWSWVTDDLRPEVWKRLLKIVNASPARPKFPPTEDTATYEEKIHAADKADVAEARLVWLGHPETLASQAEKIR